MRSISLIDKKVCIRHLENSCWQDYQRTHLIVINKFICKIKKKESIIRAGELNEPISTCMLLRRAFIPERLWGVECTSLHLLWSFLLLSLFYDPCFFSHDTHYEMILSYHIKTYLGSLIFSEISETLFVFLDPSWRIVYVGFGFQIHWLYIVSVRSLSLNQLCMAFL